MPPPYLELFTRSSSGDDINEAEGEMDEIFDDNWEENEEAAPEDSMDIGETVFHMDGAHGDRPPPHGAKNKGKQSHPGSLKAQQIMIHGATKEEEDEDAKVRLEIIAGSPCCSSSVQNKLTL